MPWLNSREEVNKTIKIIRLVAIENYWLQETKIVVAIKSHLRTISTAVLKVAMHNCVQPAALVIAK